MTSLGRLVVSGNTGTHTVKLVQANGTPVAGGSVSVATAGATAGHIRHARIPGCPSVQHDVLLVSQETAGGDSWYDLEPVTTTNTGQATGPVYSDANGNFVVLGGFPRVLLRSRQLQISVDRNESTLSSADPPDS